MIALLTPVDLGALALFLAAMLAVGFYFSSRQRDTDEFFLARRSLGWLPLGLSLVGTLLSALTLGGISGLAYEIGWKSWLIPLALWLALPVVVLVAIPVLRGLQIVSLFEYLENRFDSRLRLLATMLYLAWRWLALAGLIYFPCQAIALASGWNVPAWVLVVPLGLLATITTFLGGMRGVVWSGAIQAGVIILGTLVLLAALWTSIDGGASRVAEVARGLGRTEPFDFQFSWIEPWSLWGALPHWFILLLTLCIADQVTAQRYASARTDYAARNAFLAGTLTLTFFLPALIYLGLGLLTFYYDHPEALRPEWVANLDGQTRQPLPGPDGRQLLDPARSAHAVTWENIDRLVAERRLLQPNNKEPFASAAELVDPDTNRVLVEKLAMRRPNTERLRGEIIVREDAPREMLAHFVAVRLSFGLAGLALAALLAAALAGIGGTMLALTTLLVTDLHRRFGWGQRWLAARLGKEVRQLTSVDELQLARPLTLAVGIAATFAALLVSWTGLLTAVMEIAVALGAPLLAVFLLGLFTRRTTAVAALVALLVGSLLAIGGEIVSLLAARIEVLPPEFAVHPVWNAVGVTLATLALGYGLSFVIGRRKSNVELRGLVAGCGTLGVRASQEEHPLITVPASPDEFRWK